MTSQNATQNTTQNAQKDRAQPPTQTPILRMGVLGGEGLRSGRSGEATPETARDRHRQAVRESLAKVDGGLLALADAARTAFGDGVKLTGVRAELDGEPLTMGRLSTFTADEALEADEWLAQSNGDRAFGRGR